MDVVAKCRVTSDYEKKDLSELSLKTGDIVEVLRKGKFIWYGRLDNAKGFFPSNVAEEIENQPSTDQIGYTLSSTAVGDNEKNDTVDSAEPTETLMDSKKVDEIFKEIEAAPPLEVKRRLKSIGRPPSQVFIKGSILRSESMENLSDSSDNEENEKHQVETPVVSATITSVSQLVMEMKQKPNLKSVLQKDPVGSTTTTTSNSIITTDNASDVPEWVKGLHRKKSVVPVPNQKPETKNIDPPWMQEVRKRREHKLSLKSDDELLKVGQEFRASQENNVKHAAVEIRSFSETRTINHVVTEEKRNVQSKSFSVETHEVSSNKNVSTGTKVIQNYSFADEILDKNVAPSIENVKDSQKKIENLIETKTSPIAQTRTVTNVVVTEVIDSPSLVADTNTNSTLVEQTKCIKDAKDNSEKIELPNATKVVNSTTMNLEPKQKLECITETLMEEPKLTIDQFTESKKTSDDKDKSKNAQKVVILNEKNSSNSSSQLKSEKRQKVCSSLQLLLNEIETFEAKCNARSSEIRGDIKKLETGINQQHQEIKIFTEAMKSKLAALIETNEN